MTPLYGDRPVAETFTKQHNIHTGQTSMTSGFFFFLFSVFIRNPLSWLFSFCPDCTTHTTQKSMPPAGFFFLFSTLSVLPCRDCPGFAFCPYCTTYAAQISMPSAGVEPAALTSDRP
jgi:hypothetical protein